MNGPLQNSSIRFLCLLFALLFGPTTVASAQTEDPQKPPAPKPLRVSMVEGDIALRHYIDITVDGLKEWGQQPGHDLTKFELVIDGTPIGKLPSSPINDNSKLRFDLNSDFDRTNWQVILSRHLREFLTPKSEVTLPVTVRHAAVAVEGYQNAKLVIIDRFNAWFVVFIVSFVIAIGLFWWLSRTSDILRDTGPQPAGVDQTGKAQRKPFSLARTQMALWFFSIAISMVFIWMLTSELPTLTAGVLGLMGISAATGLGAAVVDSGKRTSEENEKNALEQKRQAAAVEVEKLKVEITALEAAVTTAPPPADLDQQNASLAEKRSQLAAKQTEIQQDEEPINKLAEGIKPRSSENFISDILSDDDGISFHRFQILAWTIVLMLVFLAKVYNQFSMPEFEGTLLGLMGISAGTYIGFKLPSQPG